MPPSSNEVLAREGIDTGHSFSPTIQVSPGSNEVLAREGIDTALFVNLTLEGAP